MDVRSIHDRRCWIGCLAGIGVATVSLGLPGPAKVPETFLYTETSRYESDAWRHGAERFPEGSQIRGAPAGRLLAQGFFASADADVSFDARTVLFAGKRRREDPWQIWETRLAGGQPRLVPGTRECVRPLYPPGGEIAVARRYGQSFQIAILARQ